MVQKFWRKGKGRRVIAWLMAGAMVLSGAGVLPVSAADAQTSEGMFVSGDTVTSGDAEKSELGVEPYGISLLSAGDTSGQTVTYLFDAAAIDAAGVTDKDPIAEGTTFADGYFKTVGTVTQRLDSKTGLTAYVETGKAEKGNIEFTVSGTAKVEIVVSSTGSSNVSPIALKQDGSIAAEKNGTTTVTGTTKVTLIYEGLTAGTYSVVSPEDASNNRGARVYSITVEVQQSGQQTETRDYTFDAAAIDAAGVTDKDPIAEGTTFADGYFKTVGTVTQRLDSKTGLTAYVETGKAEKGNIEFTVSGTAKVEMVVSSTGSSNVSPIALKQDGSIVAEKNGTTTVTGTTKVTLVYEGLAAGTYSIVSPEDASNNRGARVYSITVTETVSSSGVTVTAPVVSAGNAVLGADGKTVTVSYTGTPGSENSKYLAEASKDNGATWISVGSADGTASSGSVTVDLSGDKFGTGTWIFRVSGSGTAASTPVQAAESITYKLPLGTAAPKATVGDGKVTVTWGAVKEAESYTISLFDSETGATAVNSATVDAAAKALEAEFTGLTNGKKYWAAVTAVRTSTGDSVMGNRVAFRPYKSVDTSNAIPGMSIENQNEEAALIVLRNGGDIKISQPSASSGVSGSSRTNLSFIQYPQAVSGDFSISAAVNVQSRAITGTGGGIFLGAISDTSKDAHWVTSSLRGDGTIKVYRDKANNGGGSAADIDKNKVLTKYEENAEYKLEVKRTGDNYFVSIAKGDNVCTYSIAKADNAVEDALWGEVYPAIAFCGVSALVSDIVVSVDGSEVFNSANLTGSVSPFEDNWADADIPVVKSAVVDNEAQTIKVVCEGEVGVTGASQITLDMYDGTGTKVDSLSSSTFGKMTHEFTFTPTASGTYSFVATASRTGEETVKTSDAFSADGFILKLTGTIVSASNQGGGAVKVNWDEVKEATGYNVYYKTGDADYILAAASVQGLSTIISGLTNGASYTFKVMAVRENEECTVESTVVKTVEDVFEPDWFFSNFGSGASLNKNGFEGSANDGSVTVWSLDNGGKLVPASTDGLSFYYTKIPADKNFTLTAKATVDQWTLTNAQEGFGLMAADAVGANGDATAFWNNSYMAFAGKVEYYWDAEKQAVADSGDKISMKLGIGSQEKTGVTAENIAELTGDNASEAIVNYFHSAVRTLESSCGVNGTGTYNVIGNAQNAGGVEGTVENPVTELTFTIQKNNTGYFVSYTDASGSMITNKYYDTEALEHIDEDTVYAGFFAARACKVTFTDINLTLIDPAEDAPAEERPVTAVTPSYRIISASNANSENYDLVFAGNADGILTVKGEDGAVITENQPVQAGAKVTMPVALKKGNNNFAITFVPNQDYRPSEFEVLSSYEAASFTHTVTYKTYGNTSQALYVAPDGSSSGTGSKDSPLDIYTAVKYVQAGQTIVLRGGTYSLNSTIKVERGIDGTADNMIYMIADPEDAQRPVFDFNRACAGMIFAGDYWYCQGFDVTNSANAQKGLQISGSYSTFDNIHAYHNGNTGIQVSRYLSSDERDEWPSYDLILNCTSYGNADAGYEDADGFAAKLTVGDGIVFDGCIAYNNADDGWDLFAKPESGPIGSVTIKNCVAYGNGYLEDGTNAGNGNGFKMGGSSISGRHVLMNSVAFNNKAKGIDSNSCPDIQIQNSTTFNNGSYNVALYTNDAKNTDFAANGILSYRTEGLGIAEQFKIKGTQDSTKIYGSTNYYWDAAQGFSANTEGVKAADNWFVSLNFTGITRNADGTINMNGFLVLTDAVPAGVGAVLSGTPSAVIPVPNGTEDSGNNSGNGDDSGSGTDNNNDSNNSNDNDDDNDDGSDDDSAAQPAAAQSPAASNNTKKNVKNQTAAQEQKKGETVKKLIINQELDWNDVNAALEELMKTAKGDEAVLDVTLGKYYELSKEIVEAIRDKDVTLRMELGNGVVWEIGGRDITDAKDACMNVTLNSKGIPQEQLDELAQGKEIIPFSLEHEGEFGFKAVMKFPVGRKNNGKYANLFYYHDGAFEYVASSEVKDGSAEFTFVHASEYAVVIDAAAMTGVPEIKADNAADNQAKADSDQTKPAAAGTTTGITVEGSSKDSSLPIILAVVAVIVIGGAAIGVVMTRKKKD